MPEFRVWLSTQRRLAFEHAIDDVKQACIEHAIAGSPEHIRIVLELAGELRGRGMSSALDTERPGALQIFLNVPRPQPQQLQAPADTYLDATPAVLTPPLSREEH